MKTTICCVLNCNKITLGTSSYCEKHLARVKKYGSPEDRVGCHVPLADKFWRNVNKNGESVTPVGTPCWLWTGYAPKGYGRVWLNGKNVRAHRASWIMAYGDIPEDKIVLHRCDTSLCVNPDHLVLGTQADNVHDCIKKVRRGKTGARGERHPRAKLTEQDIHAIRTDFRTNRAIAADYGVDNSTISEIKSRKIWSHVP